jgi:hypothetical protein
VTDAFVASLIETATRGYDHVTADLGEIVERLPAASTAEVMLWVVVPGALGTTAFETAAKRLRDAGDARLRDGSVKVVLNRVSDRSFANPAELAARYGLEVVAEIPDLPHFWQQVEVEHSLRFLTVPQMDRRRFVRAYGEEAWVAKEAFQSLAATIVAGRKATVVDSAGALA